MESNLLIEALKDRFADAEQSPQASAEPSVIKREGAPTLVKDAQGNWQTMEPPHPELDPVTPRLSRDTQEKIKQEAEQRQAERVAVAKRLAKQVEQDHYRVLCGSQLPPVGPTGRPDVVFLSLLKQVYSPEGTGPENCDWKATWAGRDYLLQLYEEAKSRPKNVRPISNEEAKQLIQAGAFKVLHPAEPVIRDNRFRHSEK